MRCKVGRREEGRGKSQARARSRANRPTDLEPRHLALSRMIQFSVVSFSVSIRTSPPPLRLGSHRFPGGSELRCSRFSRRYRPFPGRFPSPFSLLRSRLHVENRRSRLAETSHVCRVEDCEVAETTRDDARPSRRTRTSGCWRCSSTSSTTISSSSRSRYRRCAEAMRDDRGDARSSRVATRTVLWIFDIGSLDQASPSFHLADPWSTRIRVERKSLDDLTLTFAREMRSSHFNFQQNTL